MRGLVNYLEVTFLVLVFALGSIVEAKTAVLQPGPDEATDL